jgi:hypothetical protein
MFNLNILLHLCLAALCSAAPVSTMSSNASQYGTGGGVVGFIVLVLDILVWSKSSKQLRATQQSARELTILQSRFSNPLAL